MWSADSSRQTIAIVGAGFSGTALAYRLLQVGDWRGRVVLIERSGRFGPGLAYGGLTHKAVLNVPAGNMSLDERRPTDFVDYARSRDIDVHPQDFLPRRLYGRYLKDRLDRAARTSLANERLVRVSGVATSVTRSSGSDGLIVAIDDGRRILADGVVLATGHSTPAALTALSPLEGTSVYVRDPWSTLPSCRPGGRVLIVGTGLSMADVVCDLVDRLGAPAKIVAVSRHGLLPGVRDSSRQDQGRESCELEPLAPSTRLSALVAAARRAVREAEARGGSWHDVMAALRMNTAQLWAGLPLVERRRFLRHLQPYWDAHRHLLPPQVGRTVQAELRAGRLEIRAARIVSAQPWKQVRE
ncbi:MAG TPA: FAD/NAD(P)-binding protein [Steroidobacteraceae bacterium]